MWPFNAGGCLIKVITWAGLTVYRLSISLLVNENIMWVWSSGWLCNNITTNPEAKTNSKAWGIGGIIRNNNDITIILTVLIVSVSHYTDHAKS